MFVFIVNFGFILDFSKYICDIDCLFLNIVMVFVNYSWVWKFEVLKYSFVL